MFTDAPPTVAQVDLHRYLGRWFEIARLPNRMQTEDCADVASDYAFSGDGNIRLTQRCIVRGGHDRIDEGLLVPADGTRSKFKLSFMPEGLRWLPFTKRDYWILQLDSGYTMSLVGSPGRRRLWLLARTRHPDPSMRDRYLAYAAWLGYDLTALIHTQQNRSPGVPGRRGHGSGASSGPATRQPRR